MGSWFYQTNTQTCLGGVPASMEKEQAEEPFPFSAVILALFVNGD